MNENKNVNAKRLGFAAVLLLTAFSMLSISSTAWAGNQPIGSGGGAGKGPVKAYVPEPPKQTNDNWDSTKGRSGGGRRPEDLFNSDKSLSKSK